MQKLQLFTISMIFINGSLGMQSQEITQMRLQLYGLTEEEQCQFTQLYKLQSTGKLQENFEELKKFHSLKDKILKQSGLLEGKSSNPLDIFDLVIPFEEFKMTDNKYPLKNITDFVKSIENKGIIDAFLYCVEKISEEDSEDKKPQGTILYYDFFHANDLAFTRCFLEDRRNLKKDVKKGEISIENISFINFEKLNKIIQCTVNCNNPIIKESLTSGVFSALNSFLSCGINNCNKMELSDLLKHLKMTFDETILLKYLPNNFQKLKEKVK